MKRFVISVLGAVLMSATAATAQCVVPNNNDGTSCQTLFAGQTIDAGTVCTEIVDDGTELLLAVTYETTGGWELVETHMWVGADIGDMPQTRKGNPKVGNFPYHSGDITGATSYTFFIPLSILGFSCPSEDMVFFLATHASLRKADGSGGYQTETGWGDGDRFVDRGAWGTFSSFTLTCDCDGGGGGEPDDCETAFAFDNQSLSQCFLDIDEDNDGNGDFNRWGWSIYVNGGGTYSYPIYAGAGQCDITKGTYVGDLEVVYDDVAGTLAVTYTMFEGFTINEVHLYVGDEVLARDVNDDFTVAPGQYPIVVDGIDANGWDYAWAAGGLEVTNGDFYLVAHAVVCGDYGDE